MNDEPSSEKNLNQISPSQDLQDDNTKTEFSNLPEVNSLSSPIFKSSDSFTQDQPLFLESSSTTPESTVVLPPRIFPDNLDEEIMDGEPLSFSVNHQILPPQDFHEDTTQAEFSNLSEVDSLSSPILQSRDSFTHDRPFFVESSSFSPEVVLPPRIFHEKLVSEIVNAEPVNLSVDHQILSLHAIQSEIGNSSLPVSDGIKSDPAFHTLSNHGQTNDRASKVDNSQDFSFSTEKVPSHLINEAFIQDSNDNLSSLRHETREDDSVNGEAKMEDKRTIMKNLALLPESIESNGVLDEDKVTLLSLLKMVINDKQKVIQKLQKIVDESQT
jgi:hypothetical protein